ncbi:rCG49470 [Rattus norvegicus]|uniref:RCG49470 n=1 Tax=Rattus norvegicus TaxID=10116 RepID=A6J2L8_RAT|nr:rCG49470 [Rattus norvegicus]
MIRVMSALEFIPKSRTRRLQFLMEQLQKTNFGKVLRGHGRTFLDPKCLRDLGCY